MGCWLRANGRLEIVPPPDDKLMIDFWNFSGTTWPEDYSRTDEYFSNTWFFDENNKLACIAGKFAEPIIWLDWMKEKFFIPRGYELIGNVDIKGESDDDFDVFDIKISREYYGWLRRISTLSMEAKCDIERIYGDLDQRLKELEAWHKERQDSLEYNKVDLVG